MSEAGKDADARPELAGDSLPVRTIARVAPQSVQLAKDHTLLGRSIWCGVVCALVAVITVVNLLPPAGVGYRVTTQILVSPKRYELLKQELTKSTPSSSDATLLSLKVLDDAKSRRLADPEKLQLLLEVSSQWNERTTTGKVQTWLTAISTLNERAVSHLDTARAQRFARWEVQTRQQYLEQHRSALLAKKASAIAEKTNAVADSSTNKLPSNIKLASNPDKPRIKFATLADAENEVSVGSDPLPSNSVVPDASQPEVSSSTLDLSSPLPTEDNSQPDEFEKQLSAELEAARKFEADVTGQVVSQALIASGKLTLAGKGRVSAIPQRMPRNQVLAIVVLALAGGALGGWVNHRAQSGGSFSAPDVSRNMQLLGLPVLGNLSLPTSELDGVEGELTRRFTDVRRWIMQQCLALAELMLLFWCLAIVIRMVLDPLWRGLLWENPLSGLARLFVGLP